MKKYVDLIKYVDYRMRMFIMQLLVTKYLDRAMSGLTL